MERSFVLRDTSIRDRMVGLLGALRIDPKKPLQIIVRPFKKKRTLEQNARYWKILEEISNQTGDSAKALHLYCREEFLGKHRYEVMGKVIEEPISTTELNTAQFANYCNQVEAWAASEHGVILPYYE